MPAAATASAGPGGDAQDCALQLQRFTRSGASMAGYVFRLLGPRPSFPGDMTPEEAAVMDEHAQYWRALTRAGTAVAFGPVADPAGVYGLAVVQADDDVAAQSLSDSDPAVRSGKGFRFEIAPMMALITRDNVDA
jgi:uncharacterized protein